MRQFAASQARSIVTAKSLPRRIDWNAFDAWIVQS